MRKNIEQLIKSGVTAYRVAKDTGIPNNTVVRIFSGEAKVDNITLKNAETLAAYWEDYKMTNNIIEIKDGDNTVLVKTIEIDGQEFYAIDADYFADEAAAERDGFYWDDEAGYWTKRIIDNTTTIF